MTIIFFLIISHSSFTQNQKVDYEQINHLIERAQSYKSSQSDSCLAYAEQAMLLSKENKYPILLIESYLLLADYHWKRSEYKNALEYAHKAEELSQDQDDKKLYARSILIIADIHIETGSSNQKLDLLFDALDIFDQQNNFKGKSHTYISISGAYYRYGNIAKALEYCQKSLDESRKINDLNGISRALNNLGAMYHELKNFEQEKLYYLESLTIAHEMNNELLAGIIYSNLSKVYSNLNDLDSSYYYLNQAMTIFKAIQNHKRIAQSYILLAIYYQKLQQYDLAFENAQIALEISKSYDLDITIAHSAQLLRELYEKTGDIENAYKNSQIYHDIKDSINSHTIDSRIEQIEMKYAFEHTLLEKESEQKHTRLIYITVFTIVITLMSLALIIMYFRSKIRIAHSIQEKIKLESELEIKHKELATNTMHLIKTNKTLNEITTHLIEVLDYDNLHDTQSAVNTVINGIKQASRSKVWKEFEIRFQQVHNNFYDNLLTRFPKLTALDLRLCALLRLNLTTKEICELTGQRTSSLEIARSRLRKKLGITDRSINLVVFLSAF